MTVGIFAYIQRTVQIALLAHLFYNGTLADNVCRCKPGGVPCVEGTIL